MFKKFFQTGLLSLLLSSSLVAPTEGNTPSSAGLLETVDKGIFNKHTTYLSLGDILNLEQVNKDIKKRCNDLSVYGMIMKALPVVLRQPLQNACFGGKLTRNELVRLMQQDVNHHMVSALALFCMFDPQRLERPPFKRLGLFFSQLTGPSSFLDPTSVLMANFHFIVAQMNFAGHGNAQNFSKARIAFTAVCDNVATTAEHNTRARYYLALLNYFGEGGPENRIEARQLFDAVLNDDAAPAQHKVESRYSLAVMNYCGEGGPENRVRARELFDAVLNDDNTTAKRKAESRYYLAQLNYFGEGGPENRIEARQLFDAVLNDDAAPAGVKARARFSLANMKYKGEGCDQDFTAARDGFTAVLDDDAVHAPDKAIARFLLANMKYKGEGCDQDFAEAKRLFTSVLNDVAAPAGVKAKARFYLDLHEVGGDVIPSASKKRKVPQDLPDERQVKRMSLDTGSPVLPGETMQTH